MEVKGEAGVNSSEIMEIINESESRFPVETWNIADIRIWPIVRLNLYFELFYGNSRNKLRSKIRMARARQLFRVISGLGRYASASMRDRRHNCRPQAADAVFLSDGISFSYVDGKWYERFCEPLMAVLGENGFSSLLLALSSEYRVPRNAPSIFLQLWLDLKKVEHELSAPRNRRYKEQLEGYEKFTDFFSLRQPGASIPSRRALRRKASLINGYADFFRTVLTRVHPAVAFIVSYYGYEGVAFNLACRRLQIPSVDIQHGLQGPLHAAYGRWMKVPREGYELLPTVFWCWSEEDAAAINAWSSAVAPQHHALVGGNMWMTQWQDGTLEFVRKADEDVEKIKHSGNGSLHILVTLQVGLSDAETLAPLLEAMRVGGEAWAWWIRVHPCMLGDRESIRRLVIGKGKGQIEIDRATNLPLYALLRHADVHITHSSSTVLEAEAFGVPSIVFSSYGTEFFPQQLKSGIAVAADTPEKIADAIRHLATRKRNFRVIRSGGTATNAIATVVDLIRRQRATVAQG